MLLVITWPSSNLLLITHIVNLINHLMVVRLCEEIKNASSSGFGSDRLTFYLNHIARFFIQNWNWYQDAPILEKTQNILVTQTARNI